MHLGQKGASDEDLHHHGDDQLDDQEEDGGGTFLCDAAEAVADGGLGSPGRRGRPQWGSASASHTVCDWTEDQTLEEWRIMISLWEIYI